MGLPADFINKAHNAGFDGPRLTVEFVTANGFTKTYTDNLLGLVCYLNDTDTILSIKETA